MKFVEEFQIAGNYSLNQAFKYLCNFRIYHVFLFLNKSPNYFNRSEVKEETGWFTTWSSAGDEIPEEKPVTRSRNKNN